MKTLPGDYIAGFVDGEGCFALTFRRDVRHKRKGSPEYFYWDIDFIIVLREDDLEILEKIQQTLQCGTISKTKSGNVRYNVSRMEDLVKIIVPFFHQYPLHAKKKFDFLLWAEAVNIFWRNQYPQGNTKIRKRGFQKVNWDAEDLSRLQGIKEEMQIYKAKGSGSKWLKKPKEE